MLLGLEQTSICFHLQTQMQVERFIFVRQIRVVGVLNETSGIPAIEFVVDVGGIPCLVQVLHFPIFTGEIDHRTRTVVLGEHVQTRNTGCISHFLIVRTEGRRYMDDTRTVFGRNVVTRDDAPSVLQFDPREERFVLQSDEVGSFVTRYYLGILEIRTQPSFRQDDMFAALEFNFYIVDLRSDAEGRVRRQRPRSGRPSDDITSVFEMEFRRTRQVLDIPIAARLVELVR